MQSTGAMHPTFAALAARTAPCLLVHTRRPSSGWITTLLGWRPTVRQIAREPWEVLDALADWRFDLVVSEMRGSGAATLGLIAMVRGAGERTPCIVVGERIDAETRRQAARLGDVSCLEWRHALRCS